MCTLPVLSVLLHAVVASAFAPEHCTSRPSVNKTLLDARYTFAQAPAPRLVPFPHSLQVVMPPAYLQLSSVSAIVLADSPAGQAIMRPAALVLAAELKAATGGAIDLEVKYDAPAPTITLTLAGNELPRLGGEEAYTLNIDTTAGVTVSAGTYAGITAATGSLLQAVELSGNHDAVPRTPQNCTTAPVWRVPAMTVSDAPGLSYRGIMVDAARAYLPLANLKAIVSLCRMYKLNFLHMHLTDDGKWAKSSTVFMTKTPTPRR
jgi:hexosaminidase